jgi:hypothetical protein
MNQYISVKCSLAQCSAAGVLQHMVYSHEVQVWCGILVCRHEDIRRDAIIHLCAATRY